MSLIRKASLTAKKTAAAIAGFADSKKAEDIIVLDMRKAANFCDYFVICSGNSDRQVKAIAEAVQEGLEGLGISSRFKQGLQDATWVIFDTGDVVTHIFQKQMREFYGLEYLWNAAKRVSWQAKKSKT